MAAFVTSLVLLIGVTALVFAYGNRRPVGTPVTWAEAILGSVVVFFLLLLAYGIVPNQWLLWAAGPLKWRADSILYVVKFWGRGKVTITKAALGDIIVTIIYVVELGANIVLWSKWQKRGRKKEAAAAAISQSTFGRPLVRKV